MLSIPETLDTNIKKNPKHKDQKYYRPFVP